MKDVIVIGASGHGSVVADIVRASGDNFLGFLDDNSATDCLGLIKDYIKYPEVSFVVGIGDAFIRERITQLIDVDWYTAVHPSAVVSATAKIDKGSVVMPNAVINANSIISKHTIINTSAVIEHDNYIDDYAHISVGVKLGGTVRVGKYSWVGIGSTIINNIDICSNVFIGAGAVVVDSIVDPGKYKGIPARRFM